MVDISSGSASIALPTPPRVKVNNLPAGGTRQAGLWTGFGAPTNVPGSRVEDEYLDKLTGDLYELRDGMAWELVTNIKGPAGDTELDEAEREQLVQEAAQAAQDTFDTDLVLLFENKLI